MADDMDDYYEDDYGYFYIEDSYGIADDLAEHAVASPVPYEGDDEWNDQSRYEYWNDIEYDSDGYNDVDGKQKKKAIERLEVSGAKRKANSEPESPSKRRKVHRREHSIGISPVAWKVKADATQSEELITSVEGLKSVSLLEDWRERFRDAKGLGPPREQHVDGDVSGDSDIVFEDGGEEEEQAEDVDGVQLDPEVLQLALRKNLESIGLGTAKINEATLLKLATRMTANMDKADEILGEFVESLLGGEEDEEADQFSQWALKKAEEASKVEPDDVNGDQTTVKNPAPSHVAAEEANAKVHSHQIDADADADALGVQLENSMPPDEIDKILSPGTSRKLKRKAESPTSSPRKKKVNRAPDQVRASS